MAPGSQIMSGLGLQCQGNCESVERTQPEPGSRSQGLVAEDLEAGHQNRCTKNIGKQFFHTYVLPSRSISSSLSSSESLLDENGAMIFCKKELTVSFIFQVVSSLNNNSGSQVVWWPFHSFSKAECGVSDLRLCIARFTYFLRESVDLESMSLHYRSASRRTKGKN
jgi:hypothetical protein